MSTATMTAEHTAAVLEAFADRSAELARDLRKIAEKVDDAKAQATELELQADDISASAGPRSLLDSVVHVAEYVHAQFDVHTFDPAGFAKEADELAILARLVAGQIGGEERA